MNINSFIIRPFRSIFFPDFFDFFFGFFERFLNQRGLSTPFNMTHARCVTRNTSGTQQTCAQRSQETDGRRER